MMHFQLIVTLLKSELTPDVIKAAKKAGAPGSTILPAHGTGIHEAKSFFGMELDTSTDAVLFLVEEHLVDDILEAIGAAGRFDEPGTGIAYVQPVLKAIGLQAQIPHFQRVLKRHEVSADGSDHVLIPKQS